MKKMILILILAAFCLTAQEAKRFYTGLRLGGGIGMVYPVGEEWYYFFSDKSDPNLKWRTGGSFDIAPFVSLQITDRFAIQAEVMITRFGYWGLFFEEREQNFIDMEKEQVSRPALLFPLLAKYTHRRNNFNFQMYAGPHFTANIGQYRIYVHYKYSDVRETFEFERTWESNDFPGKKLKIPPMGFMLGTNFGYITTKAGTIFADARFLGDMGVVKEYDRIYGWWPFLYRAKISLTLGYEFGFINR